ncbi:hypothetical protein [Legionella shakespearei]|uniref:Uncharacterized protein n=1 Tax=Legionella shakespearei DSM 23087 TaxID=1122169 RepID=A0A0W0ZEU9_9GAMM|nr:hypothetical protein [Legionella shakespearei]KTD67560.1 hypothetical protein Lsha_0001 [Legionella shakespearei DSM 23087]
MIKSAYQKILRCLWLTDSGYEIEPDESSIRLSLDENAKEVYNEDCTGATTDQDLNLAPDVINTAVIYDPEISAFFDENCVCISFNRSIMASTPENYPTVITAILQHPVFIKYDKETLGHLLEDGIDFNRWDSEATHAIEDYSQRVFGEPYLTASTRSLLVIHAAKSCHEQLCSLDLVQNVYESLGRPVLCKIDFITNLNAHHWFMHADVALQNFLRQCQFGVLKEDHPNTGHINNIVQQLLGSKQISEVAENTPEYGSSPK